MTRTLQAAARRVAMCALWAGAAGMPAHACGDGLDAARRVVVDGAPVRLAYDSGVHPLAVGRHFALDIVLCGPPGGPAPVLLRVDADMPAHRHGMNYRPGLTRLAADRWRAEGLMLHMPGAWRFVFDVDLGGRRLQLVQPVELP